MISLCQAIWSHFFDSRKKERELLERKLTDEKFLQRAMENEQKEKEAKLNKENVVYKRNADETDTKENFENSRHCFRKEGVITSMFTNRGVIDYTLSFDMSAFSTFGILKAGTKVSYLAYQNPETEHVQLVKILNIIEDNWERGKSDNCTEDEIEKQVNELRLNKPTFFKTHNRNILGLIIEKSNDTLIVDIDYDKLLVNMNELKMDFVPKVGDRVLIVCKVQLDETFVDQQGEILEKVSLHAARTQDAVKSMIRHVYADYGVLNDNCYFTFDVLPDNYKPNIGDTVTIDIVECEKDEFIWRCIRMEVLDHAPQMKQATNMNDALVADKICFQPNKLFLQFDSAEQSREITIKVINNRDRKLHVTNVEISNEKLMRHINPPELTGFVLKSFDVYELKFVVTPQGELEDMVKFTLNCGRMMKLTRTIHIIVCDDGNETKMTSTIRTSEAFNNCKRQSSCLYANKVYSNDAEVLRGPRALTNRRFVAQRIPPYDVPEALRTAYLTSLSKQEMVQNMEEKYPFLQETLSLKNYVLRMGAMLYMEEIETFLAIRKYDRERAHFQRDGEYLSLQIENLAEKRPSLVVGDIVRAINPWYYNELGQRCYEGVINKVLFDRVLVKFHSSFMNKYNGEDYCLEFFFSRFVYRKQHFSIERVVKQQGEEFLFPSKVTVREAALQLNVELRDEELFLNDKLLKWYNPHLNHVQKRAITNALRGEALNLPYIIYGPPGTGKTITLVEIILQLAKNIPSSRLIVATPSNSSANLITTRLIESGFLQPGEIVRLVSHNLIQKDLIPPNLAKYCATCDIGIDGTGENNMVITESGLKLRCQMNFLGTHRVTISTCNTIGGFHQLGFPHNHFTHVIIDEAGQCHESEIMMPISLLSSNSGKVIMAGDPQQLQPIVMSSYAKSLGYSVSFLERILTRVPYKLDMERFGKTNGFDPRLVTKLIFNYRALPSVLNVYNELFYRAELLPQLSETSSREAEQLKQLQDMFAGAENRPLAHGTFFYGLRSTNVRENDSPSWFNPQEAKNVFLMTIKLYRHNIKPENIGIITPYFKQVKHLRNIFIESDIAMPKIGSVEEFQGQERDIILISTVRSNSELIQSYDLKHSLGFVQCRRRMNVAVSRSRLLTIVIGNPYLLCQDLNWKSYIQYCVDNNAYMGCELPENVLN